MRQSSQRESYRPTRIQRKQLCSYV